MLFLSVRSRINFLQPPGVPVARHSGQYCEHNKIDTHLNLALSAVNAANAAKAETGIRADQLFSIEDVKVLHHNQLLPDWFISILPRGVELDKNALKVRELYTSGCKAA